MSQRLVLCGCVPYGVKQQPPRCYFPPLQSYFKFEQRKGVSLDWKKRYYDCFWQDVLKLMSDMEPLIERSDPLLASMLLRVRFLFSLEIFLLVCSS